MRLLLPLLLILPTAALAETYEVKMLNRNMTGPMVYEPDHLSIAPGDTVKFLATDKGHNAAHRRNAAGRRRCLQRQHQRGSCRDADGGGPLRREVLAALRDGHGDADRGRRRASEGDRPTRGTAVPRENAQSGKRTRLNSRH